MNYKSAKTEYRCDACAQILVGYDHNVFKNKDYICIKGQLILQLYDEEIDSRYYAHLMNKDQQMITVCDLKCLKNFMDVRHAQYINNRNAHLRAQAGQLAPPKTRIFNSNGPYFKENKNRL